MKSQIGWIKTKSITHVGFLLYLMILHSTVYLQQYLKKENKKKYWQRNNMKNVSLFFPGIAIGSWIAGGLVQFIGASATFKLFGWFASFMFVFHYTIQKALWLDFLDIYWGHKMKNEENFQRNC